MDDLERGFISKEQILEYVSDSDIFSLVFGFKPTEYMYVTSPFRKDNFPGCWFSVYNNKLRFIDFANTDIINGIKMNNIDCFNAVQVYYKLNNFYRTLEFIKEKLIDNKNIQHKIRIIKPRIKKNVLIHIEPKEYNLKDKRFWSKYGISKQNLIDDNVFSVKKFILLNTRNGNIIKRVTEPCYAFSNFDNNRKKIYRPFQKGHHRFISNCKADDIGEINSLIDYGEQLIISKSYKDCRVLRNEKLNCIWFQNEGVVPCEKNLISLCKRFTFIIVFFDNDNAGITSSIKIKNIINNYFPNKATNLYLPIQLNQLKITDPSDLYKKKGPLHLKKFLKDNI